MNQANFIGFDRKIDSAWLDAVAAQAAAGVSRADTQAWMYKELLKDLGGEPNSHSAKGKTATVLLRIWYPQKPGAMAVQQAVLAVLADAGPDERVALHWALCIAAYPFFLEVARQVGRLTALQGDTTTREVTRRVAEQYGDRSTLPRAVYRVVQSATNWQLLAVEKSRIHRRKPVLLTGEVGRVLALALMAAAPGGTTEIDVLRRDPAGFAFVW